MRTQRNMAQMKEQNKTPEIELNEMETAHLSDAEFKTLVIRMLRELTEYGKSIRQEIKATMLLPFKAGQIHMGFGHTEENSWSRGNT